MGWGRTVKPVWGRRTASLNHRSDRLTAMVITKSWGQHDGQHGTGSGIDAEVDDSDREDDDPAKEADNGIGDAGGLTEKTVRVP